MASLRHRFMTRKVSWKILFRNFVLSFLFLVAVVIGKQVFFS